MGNYSLKGRAGIFSLTRCQQKKTPIKQNDEKERTSLNRKTGERCGKMEKNEIQNIEETPPKKRRKGPGPVIIPKHISDWARDQSHLSPINNFKKGGGHDPWNK